MIHTNIIKHTIIILAFFFFQTAYSQQIAKIKSVKINSISLNQDREILIYTPANYNEDLYVYYDVIYVFDSQNRELFDFTHSSLSFIETNKSKHFIVVGITSPGIDSLDYYRNNDMLPPPINVDPNTFYNGYSGNANNFLKYVSEEVITYIDNNYRTMPNRIAVGHSLSASLILYSSFTNPELFNSYIAISPNLSYDKNRIADELINNDYSKINTTKFIYLSHADEGTNYWKEWKPARDSVYTFINNFAAADNIIFEVDSFPQCNHWTTFAPGVTNGLIKYLSFTEKHELELSSEKYSVTITVEVPNKKDKVYITGNQPNIGNWNSKEIKLDKISDYVRQIQLEVQSPAIFKFTRGTWETEAILEHNDGMENITIKPELQSNFSYKIIDWTDREE